jgi:hypothetical protein
VTDGKDVDVTLAEAGSTVEMAEALRASGQSMICWLRSIPARSR